MNRNLKFRAWDGEQMYLSPSLREMHHLASWLKVHSKNGPMFKKEDSLVMQYTGAMDKKGTEICEGDLLQDQGGNVLLVKWLQSHCQFILEHSDEIFDLSEEEGTAFEIIGNIFQNPELL